MRRDQCLSLDRLRSQPALTKEAPATGGRIAVSLHVPLQLYVNVPGRMPAPDDAHCTSVRLAWAGEAEEVGPGLGNGLKQAGSDFLAKGI